MVKLIATPFLPYRPLRPIRWIYVSFDLGKLNTSCPYGFPLLIKNNLQLRKKLWNKGIHSFILWNKLHPNIEENKSLVSEYLSNSIIILPVNHDLPIKDIDTVIEAINE